MFRTVEEWWNSISDEGKDELRQKLSREGVKNGENHKEGVHDSGHGCAKPLGMHKNYSGGSGGGSMEDRIAGAAAGAIMEGVTGGVSEFVKQSSGGQINLPDSSGGGGNGLGDFLSGGGGSSSGGGGGGLVARRAHRLRAEVARVQHRPVPQSH